MKSKIVNIINDICQNHGYELIDINDENNLNLKLREDIGFDSLNLAQLTVLIEDEFDVDIFEDGIVNTLGEILKKIENG
jgi:acyl carrier protein